MVMEDEEPRVPTEGAREQGVSLRRDHVPQEGNKGWGPSENFKGMKRGDGGRGFYGHGGDEQHRKGNSRFGGGGKDRGGKQHHGAYQHSRDGGSYQHKYEPDYQNYNSSFHRGGGSYTYQGERGGYEGYHHAKNAPASGYNQNPNYRQPPPRGHDRGNYCPPARTGTGRPPTAQDTDLRGLSHREKKQALQGIVCRHYLAGSCTKGTYCRFRHPVDPNDFSSPSLSQNGSLPRGEGPLMINERRARFDGFHGPPLPPEERTRYLQSVHRDLGRGRNAASGGAPSGSDGARAEGEEVYGGSRSKKDDVEEGEDSEKMASLVKQLAVRVQNLRGGGSKKSGAPPPDPPTGDQLHEKEKEQAEAEPVERNFYSTSTGEGDVLLGGNGKKMQTLEYQQKDVGESVLLGDLTDLLRDLIAAKSQNLSQGEQGAAVGSSSATSA